MNKSLFSVLIIALFVSTFVEAGQIYSWDVDIKYQNAKWATKICLFFSLETPLETGGIVQFTFPESTLASTVGFITAAGTAAPESGTTAYTSSALTVSVSTGVADITTTSALSANTWYTATIIVTSTSS